MPWGRTMTMRAASVPASLGAATRVGVREIINRLAETKYVSSAQTRQFNSTISSATECYPLVPQVSQGFDDYQRTGDKISPKYLVVKGYLQYHSSITSQPYVPPSTVRIMILSQKNIKVGSAVSTSVDTQHLIKDNQGGGAARPYQGVPTDNLSQINPDLFTVHMDRKVKLNWLNQHTLDGATPAPGWQVGNDLTKYFYCRIPCPKTLTFDQGNADYPNNFAPFICVGGVNDDGSAAWTVGTPYNVCWLSTLYYKDF